LEAMNYFATEAGQVDLPAFEILAPIPMTGDWAAGQTFRTAALFAEGLINSEQFLLPGYRIKHVFADDQCDESVATDLVLSEISVKDTYIGIGGLGCSESCSRLASFTTSMRLPVVSYACPAPELSEVENFPTLIRLGTPTTGYANMLSKVKDSLQGEAVWNNVFVISGNQVRYGVEAQNQVATLNGGGFTATKLDTTETDFDSMKSTMLNFQEQTNGFARAVFVVGSETFFRKLICASIVAGLKQGITWLSQGTWRDEWWKKTDTSMMFYSQWLVEDSHGKQMKEAFAAFNEAWGEFNSDKAETRKQLHSLYKSEDLAMATGDGSYHVTHGEWHQVYRKEMRDRKYLDAYLINVDGDVIYSVQKNRDFATNVVNSDSALGQVFAAVIAEPGEVAYRNVKSYAQSNGQPAAFFGIGLRNDEGNVVGAYVLRPPLDFEESIEYSQEQCSLEAITAAYEGGLNVGGHGEVIGQEADERMSCVKGHSPRSLMQLLNAHWSTGYPKGDVTTQVAAPFYQDAAHAVDGVCAYAMTVKHLLQQGYSMEQIQKPDEEVYAKFNTYMKTELDFLGASGRWQFEGNDKPANLVLQQIQDGSAKEVGMLYMNKTISVHSVASDDWTRVELDGFQHMWLLSVGLGVIGCCAPFLAGLCIGLKRSRAKRLAKRADDSKV